jgi:hypothetical protein
MTEVQYLCEWIVQPDSRLGFIHPIAIQMNCSIMVTEMIKNQARLHIISFLVKAPSKDAYQAFVERITAHVSLINCTHAEALKPSIPYPDAPGLHVPHLTGGSFIEALQNVGRANHRVAKRKGNWLIKVTSRILDLLAMYTSK